MKKLRYFVHKEDRCKDCEYEERADYEFERMYDR